MIDLSMGVMKDSLPEHVLQRFKEECFAGVSRYPNYEELSSRLASRLGAEHVALTAGVDSSISVLSRAYGKDIVIFPPTYYEYFHTPKRNGITVSEVNCFDGENYSLPADASGRSLVFLANPNNPFGVPTQKEIRELVSSTDGVIAVDEAYIDFGGESAAPLLKDFENLVVLRSFSKGFGLSGARVACIAGAKSVVEKASSLNQFFPASSVSVNMALIALEEEDLFRNMRDAVMHRKKGFEEFLAGEGYRVMPSSTLVTVVKFPSDKEATSFREKLKGAGIIVGQGDGISCYGLDDSFVRINAGLEEELAALKKALP